MSLLDDALRVTPQPGTVVAASHLTPPWGLVFVDDSPLALEVVVRGSAWLRPEAGEPLPLGPGDLVLARGAYVLADSLETRPGAVVHGPARVGLAGEPAAQAGDRWRLPGPRAYGDDLDAPTLVVHGRYRSGTVPARRLLSGLPAAWRMGRAALPPGAVDLLEDAVRTERPGQQAVLDQLLALLVIYALRAWVVDAAPGAAGWLRGIGDPCVGPALAAIHDHPRRPWTVAALAAEAGTSRAQLARRFHELVGMPPITYLTEHRIELASELLSSTGLTIGAVARAVGYSDAFTLSTAYRRVTGTPPSSARGSS